jgi:hypothetical protein
MIPTLKRKGKDILFPSAKKGRGKVVHNLAVQVHELQVEGINPLGSRMDGSSCGSKKYGLMKTTINEAVKI